MNGSESSKRARLHKFEGIGGSEMGSIAMFHEVRIVLSVGVMRWEVKSGFGGLESALAAHVGVSANGNGNWQS